MSVRLQGSYSHKLDGKGRMVLPARFRDVLGDNVVAAASADKWRYVSVYSADQWEAYLSRVEDLSLKGGRARDLRRIIAANAHEVDVDAAGRILIPQQLRARASIETEVSVNGNIDHIEIWNMDAWNEYNGSNEDIGDLMEGIEGI